jgi:hypothetical protein
LLRALCAGPRRVWSRHRVAADARDAHAAAHRAVGPGTTAPGSFDREREVPSTRGTGDELFIVPNDPAGPTDLGIETMGSPEDPTTSPGVPGGSNTAPDGAVKPGQNPGVAPGATPPALTPGAGTNPGGSAPPSGAR